LYDEGHCSSIDVAQVLHGKWDGTSDAFLVKQSRAYGDAWDSGAESRCKTVLSAEHARTDPVA